MGAPYQITNQTVRKIKTFTDVSTSLDMTVAELDRTVVPRLLQGHIPHQDIAFLVSNDDVWKGGKVKPVK